MAGQPAEPVVELGREEEVKEEIPAGDQADAKPDRKARFLLFGR